MTVIFELNGQKLMELNGGPAFKFNEAVSFVVTCETQIEIDYYWSRLTEDGGQAARCGWLKDKYGVSWQIVPSMFGQWMSDQTKAPKVVQAFMKMSKIDIEQLQQIVP